MNCPSSECPFTVLYPLSRKMSRKSGDALIGRMQFVPTGANNYGLLLNVADLTASRQKIALSQGEGDYVLS